MTGDTQIKTLLSTAVKQLTDVDNPHLEAEILLSTVLNKPRSYLIAWADKPLMTKQCQQFQALLTRRMQGEPIAYITGHREFWSLDLWVNKHTLIPRPETELLVEHTLIHSPTSRPCHIADLGTGTGAIALALAAERPCCHVVATDIDPLTLQLAQTNAHRLHLRNVEFISSDWFSALHNKKFHVIVSNPPYIPNHDEHLKQGDVRFEPQHALTSGEDGLQAITILTQQAPNYLKKEGWLLIEHGYDQGQAVRALFLQNGFTQIASYHDLNGQERITIGRKR